MILCDGNYGLGAYGMDLVHLGSRAKPGNHLVIYNFYLYENSTTLSVTAHLLFGKIRHMHIKRIICRPVCLA